MDYKIAQAELGKAAIFPGSGKLFCLLLLFYISSHSHKNSVTYGIGLHYFKC